MRLSGLSPRTLWLTAIFIALLHAWMAITAANTKSPTFDEPQHLTAGYSYWVTNDFRLDPENGNLPAMWAALPLLFDQLKFIPLTERGWQRGEEGSTAHQFFYEMGNDPDRMMRQARAMMSIFGVALCLLVFRIGRHLFGNIGGFVAEIVLAFDPNFLAHSALVTSDVPAAFFFTATVWSCWQVFQQVAPVRAAVAALSLSGLFLTKFSAPIVLPVLGALLILQIFSRQEITLKFRGSQIALTKKWKKACALGALSLVLATTLFIAIWASCSFRYDAWNDGRSDHDGTVWHWNYLLEEKGPVGTSISFARTHHLLPEQYLYGFAYVRKHEIDRPAFLDNQWSIVGFRSFFPLAFLYKTPLPFLFVLALGIYGAIANRRSAKVEKNLNPLSAFIFVYGAFALSSQLNIGHRHLLPIYPALFVACGAVVYLLKQNRRGIFAAAAALLVCWQIGESLAARPNYLAYLNQIAGGPSHGYEHLVDSSLDWGQDLPALKSWIDNHHAVVDQKRVYLAYFGTADPRWYDIQATSLSPEKRGDRDSVTLAGGVYCISATTLQNVYGREIGPWCAAYELRYQEALANLDSDAAEQLARVSNDRLVRDSKRTKEFQRLRFERLCAYLRHQSPIAQIGGSIFVFNLSDDDLNRALYGPPAELLRTVQVNGL